MLAKPEIGAPCNRCGLCCQVRVCSSGSYAQGLVERIGDRADGPCPALIANEDGGFDCGLMLRPNDFIKTADRGVTVLREAVSLCIGAGAGCDEAGDEPDETAQPKLAEVQREYVRRHGIDKLKRAARTIFGL